MSNRPIFPILLAFAALLFAAGCERTDGQAYTAEVDEAGFRRGKDLLRQGRNQEALSEFSRVLATRGLNNSPETHLELALLYQQHIGDPIAAIYHYQKFRELKPNSDQSELVRQRIEAAKREFVRTLPGRPAIDAGSAPIDYAERIGKMQTEINRLQSALRAALATAQAAGAAVAQPQPQIASAQAQVRAQPQPIQPAPVSAAVAPSRPPQTAPQQPQQAQPIAAGRRHIVKPSESLYSIARQYYGSPVTRAQVDAIVNANRNILQSASDPLRIGMELRIP